MVMNLWQLYINLQILMLMKGSVFMIKGKRGYDE